MWSLVVTVFLVNLVHIDATFYYNPGNINLHENEDGAINLHSFTAYCTVTTTCSYTYSYGCTGYRCTSENCYSYYYTCYATGYYTCYPTYTCNQCRHTNGDTSRFEVSGTTQFRKLACSDPGCGPTCTASGCNNAGNTYSNTVRCRRSGYSGDGANSMTFDVTITSNAAPTFYWSHGDPFNVYQTSNNGDTVNRVVASDSDAYIDNDYIRYYLSGTGVDPSYIHGNTLFTYDTSNGNINVASDLTNEFSNYYYITACIYDRRTINNKVCDQLNITLNACYQTPNCTNQVNMGIHDTHGTYTNHGTTNTLYMQIYPQPDDQFPDFHNGWHQLIWEFTRNDFDNLNDPPVLINRYTGEIYIDRNISIFPSYPSQDFTMIVQVSNPSASCYVTTCTFTTRVWYMNWPIEIRSLPATSYLHEDYDWKIVIHTLVLFDYNYYWEDNFTCTLTSVSSNTGVNEADLFSVEQVSGGAYTYNSWRIYKLVCQDPDCGYLNASTPFICDNDIGCMNHNLTQEYYITVTCEDGYNTSDTEILTFRPIQNRAPYYTNLPKTITLDSDKIANLDIVYSMTYWDLENETLYYNYTYTESSTGQDPGFWLGTTWGNFYDSLGNISATVHFWNTTNSTFTIYICGHERRNLICDYLYIRVHEYCGPTPSCTGTTLSITNEQAVGSELFDISSQVENPSNGGSYTSLSFAIAHNDNYFVVNSATGSVTLNSALPAVFPNKTYSISAYVYDEAACEYAQCTNTLYVEAVNNDISIDNLPASVNIHEDTDATTSLFLVATSDADGAADSTACSITAIIPDESDPDHFFLKETFSGSEVFQVYCKDEPAFTSATLLYLVTIECHDTHESTATGTLSVNIDENQAPTLTNLANPTTITLDPATALNGTLVYTVSTSDTENDAITFNCTVASTEVPFECNGSISETGIVISRALDINDDDGVTYSIDVCISDAKHYHAACGSLQATLTSSRTYPYISNLPDTVTVAETLATGSNLFDIDFIDPDTGETHIFTLLEVVPSSGSSLFSLNSATGVVSSAGSFNFETQSHYSLEFTVADNYLTSQTSSFLYVNITNVNESPTLSANVTYVNVTEGILEGANLLFEFTVDDPDIGDTHTFTLNGSYSNSFSVNSETGEVSMATAWNLENGDPTTVNLQVLVTDAGGLTDSVDLTIEFSDVNDNTPSITVSDATSTLTVSSSTNVIDDILTVTCSDDDVGDDGFCHFGILGSGEAADFFVMDVSSKRAIGSTAVLRLKAPISFDTNRTFEFTILVSDGTGMDALNVGIPVTVTYIATAPADPTRPTSCTTCTTRGKWLIGFLVIEAIIVGGLIAHVIWHFCFRYRKNSKEEKNLQTAVIYSRRKSRGSNMPHNSKFGGTASSQNKTTSRGKTQSSSKDVLSTKIQSSRPTATPSSMSVTSGLYSKSSHGQNKTRVSSDIVISNIETSSSDSSDSSDDQVTIQPRSQATGAKRDIPNIGFQGHQYSTSGSSGLPRAIYR